MSLRITTNSLSIIGQLATPHVRVTRQELRVMGTGAVPAIRATRVMLQVMGGLPPPNVRVCRVEMRMICTFTPSFEFSIVLYPDVFPKDISYNSVASVRFATDVIVVDSGDDQRIGRWDQPLMEYDVAYGIRTMEDLQGLIGFFRAMHGRLYGFNYQDNVDYSSSYAVADEARRAPPITMLDQTIGVGDGVTFVFQLTKVYASQSQSNVRPITRPQPGTTLIGLDGVPYVSFTVDTNTGLVTFTPPASVDIAHGVSKSALSSSNSVFTGIAGDFTLLAGFIGRPCAVSGWVNPNNNRPISSPVTAAIAAVAGDGSTVTIAYPTGYGNTIETSVTGITVAIGEAPLNDVVITAGFLFYVPVRFDTDTLPVTIEDYGVGGANSVKLIEVRSSDQ
jgi:uncharacterized protein (TIGR02217 family)